ncbi:hypothetical protein PCASD_19943 [Puccinia coronata f. sp. avenae]|uniref:XMAP215/Dis1/CLASP TOG domain-containing protein n=1 Tax=Puccinia coronata f. sp. avenae TaxID=200324 RepID=A0A2N5SL37_9BASI|nr:hypothetical protein PCASD_19943 [Puccinia coronata f. sp. avenae]
MADPPADSDWQTLSVQEQLCHKLWKARLAAYESLIKQFQLAEDEHDDVFTDWNRDHQWPQKAVMGLECRCSGERRITCVDLHSIGGSGRLKMSLRLYHPAGR